MIRFFFKKFKKISKNYLDIKLKNRIKIIRENKYIFKRH
jgi:hypothetical protein